MEYALIIATNYDQGGTSVTPLKGCLNDAQAFEKFIKAKYLNVKITTLYNQQVMMDTVKTQISRHVNLLNNSQANNLNNQADNLFFLYFAGHCVNIYDNSGDEIDGMDEAIVCYNGQTLVDDWFYENLILKLGPRNKCILINDCCRSGSIYDLPVSYSFDRNENCMKSISSTKRILQKNSNSSTVAIVGNSSIKAKCIGISGCADSQYSMEFNEDKKTVRGIFTAGLIQALSKKLVNVTEESCTSLGNRIQEEMDSIWKVKFGYPMQYFKQFVNVSTSPELDTMHKTIDAGENITSDKNTIENKSVIEKSEIVVKKSDIVIKKSDIVKKRGEFDDKQAESNEIVVENNTSRMAQSTKIARKPRQSFNTLTTLFAAAAATAVILVMSSALQKK